MSSSLHTRPRLRSLTIALSLTAYCLPTFANLALPPSDSKTIQLDHEEVTVQIADNKAKVSGTFRFVVVRTWQSNNIYQLYLPVYAAEGTDPQTIKPTLTIDDVAYPMVHQSLPKISTPTLWGETPSAGLGYGPQHFQPIQQLALDHPFGEIPTIEGQKPYWFCAAIALGDAHKEGTTLKAVIGYEQDLAQGAFIYTPLISMQNPEKNYGSITLSADRPLILKDHDQHEAIQKDGKWVVTPHHARSIIVQAADKP